MRKHYSENNFWSKSKEVAKDAGSRLMRVALQLFYAAQNPKTPRWAKMRIYAALGYFIFPLDAIPDFIPVIGYSDDLSLLALAVLSVAYYIDEDVKKKTNEKLTLWFGSSPEPESE